MTILIILSRQIVFEIMIYLLEAGWYKPRLFWKSWWFFWVYFLPQFWVKDCLDKHSLYHPTGLLIPTLLSYFYSTNNGCKSFLNCALWQCAKWDAIYATAPHLLHKLWLEMNRTTLGVGHSNTVSGHFFANYIFDSHFELSYFQNVYFSKILWCFHDPHNQVKYR